MEVLTLHCELEKLFCISMVRGLLRTCLTLGVVAMLLHSFNFPAVCWTRGVWWLTHTTTLIFASNFLEADSAVHAHCRFASSLLLKIHTSLSMLHLSSERVCCGLWNCWVLHLEDIDMSDEICFNILDHSWHNTSLMRCILAF